MYPQVTHTYYVNYKYTNLNWTDLECKAEKLYKSLSAKNSLHKYTLVISATHIMKLKECFLTLQQSVVEKLTL